MRFRYLSCDDSESTQFLGRYSVALLLLPLLGVAANGSFMVSKNSHHQESKFQQDHRSLIVGGQVVEDFSSSSFAHAFAWSGIGGDGWGCGGSLLTTDIILTAAHCQWVFTPGAPTMIGAHFINGSGGVTLLNEYQVIHPGFDFDLLQDDIMLVKLNMTGASNTTTNNDYIPFPTHTMHLPPKATVRVMGFGTTAEKGGHLSSRLRQVNVNIVPYTECAAIWKQKRGFTVNASTHLCAGTAAGHKDACDSDSGSPLLYYEDDDKFVQVGIVVDGIGCARPGIPALYLRVDAYTDWIQETLCQISSRPPVYCKNKTSSSQDTVQPTKQDNDQLDDSNDQEQQEGLDTNTMDMSQPQLETNSFFGLEQIMMGVFLVATLVLVGFAYLPLNRRQPYDNSSSRNRLVGYGSLERH